MSLTKQRVKLLAKRYKGYVAEEIEEFGVPATEATGILSRAGELHVAARQDAYMAPSINQHGYDVIKSDKTTISVKTTAQTADNNTSTSAAKIFIRESTMHLADETHIVQYIEGKAKYKMLYEGCTQFLVEHGYYNEKSKKFEITLTIADKVNDKLKILKCLNSSVIEKDDMDMKRKLYDAANQSNFTIKKYLMNDKEIIEAVKTLIDKDKDKFNYSNTSYAMTKVTSEFLDKYNIKINNKIIFYHADISKIYKTIN